MPEKGIIFGETAGKQIAKTVREHARRTVNEQPHRGRWQQKENGGTIRWGKVTGSSGCGVYSVELGTLGNASASGSEGCSGCGTVASSGTSDCSIEINYPESRVIGSGVFVTAYDPESTIVPLRVGSDCMVARIQNPQVSSSGGGSEEQVWGIVRGLQEHLVQYRERGECCPTTGQWVTTHKTPIIFPGIECDEIQCAECPTGSGSESA